MKVAIKEVFTSQSAKTGEGDEERIKLLKTQIAGVQEQLAVLQNELNLALKRKAKVVDDSKNAVLAAKAKELKAAGVKFAVIDEAGYAKVFTAITTALDKAHDGAKLYALREGKRSLIARCRPRARLDGPPVKGSGGATHMGHYIWNWTTETARKKYLGI
jgi:hypothetical protein